MTNGVWFEVFLESARAKVFGQWVTQALEEKNQSSLSRWGLGCLLVQVNLHPLSRISEIISLLMASLNLSSSCKFPSGFFLFDGDRRRLKSPIVNHLTSSSMVISLNHIRKSRFPSGVHSAYTFVRTQVSPDKTHWNSTDWTKLFWKIRLPTNLELFHSNANPWGPNRGKKLKGDYVCWVEVFDVLLIKELYFDFLELDNITITFSNLVFYCIPFSIRVNPSNVPAKDNPTSVNNVLIHYKQNSDTHKGLLEQ